MNRDMSSVCIDCGEPDPVIIGSGGDARWCTACDSAWGHLPTPALIHLEEIVEVAKHWHVGAREYELYRLVSIPFHADESSAFVANTFSSNLIELVEQCFHGEQGVYVEELQTLARFLGATEEQAQALTKELKPWNGKPGT